jgi:hypothetical protein
MPMPQSEVLEVFHRRPIVPLLGANLLDFGSDVIGDFWIASPSHFRLFCFRFFQSHTPGTTDVFPLDLLTRVVYGSTLTIVGTGFGGAQNFVKS